MDINEAFELVDSISTDEGYAIDLFPEPIYHDGFYELEDYFLETFLQEFADKISRIVIKMIHYYDAIIYITEFPEDAPRTEYHTMTDQDLRSLPLQQIVNIVQFVVTQGRTSVGLIFPETPFVIEIRGGDEFSVSVYGIQHNQKEIRILKALVEQEGLFLRS